MVLKKNTFLGGFRRRPRTFHGEITHEFSTVFDHSAKNFLYRKTSSGNQWSFLSFATEMRGCLYFLVVWATANCCINVVTIQLVWRSLWESSNFVNIITSHLTSQLLLVEYLHITQFALSPPPSPLSPLLPTFSQVLNSILSGKGLDEVIEEVQSFLQQCKPHPPNSHGALTWLSCDTVSHDVEEDKVPLEDYIITKVTNKLSTNGLLVHIMIIFRVWPEIQATIQTRKAWLMSRY